MEFKSGMLGCLICVLALMGSILAGFVMDVDATTQQTTAYDYVTDVTGLFSTTSSPEYIEYSPSTNFVGYTEQSVNYVDSTTPNAYRYVANSGFVRTETLNIEDLMDHDLDSWMTTAVMTTSQHRPVLVNYTGTTYNFGTAINFNSIYYNISAMSEMDGTPRMTTLYDFIQDSGMPVNSWPLTLNITNNGSPLIAFPSSSMITSAVSYGADTLRMYSITGGDELIPDRFTVSGIATTATVNAYRGNTLLWSSQSIYTYIIYEYMIVGDGASNYGEVSSTMTNPQGYGSGSYTVTSGVTDSTWVSDVAYPSSLNFYLNVMDSTTGYNFGPASIYVDNSRNANVKISSDDTGMYLAITPFQSIRDSILQLSYSQIGSAGNPNVTITKTDNGTYPVLIGTGSNYGFGLNLGTNLQYGALIDNYVDVDTFTLEHGSDMHIKVKAYKNNTLIWEKNEDWTWVIFAYSTTATNMADVSLNTTFNLTYGNPSYQKPIGSSTSYSFTTDKTFPEEPTFVNILYTGTEYTLGTPVTKTPVTYNGYIKGLAIAEIGGASHTIYPVHTLSYILNKFNPTNTEYEATIDITHGEYSSFFCYSLPLIPYHFSNVGAVNFYMPQVDDNNIPDRIIWDMQTGYVTISKDGNTVYNGPSDEVYVIWAWNGIASGTYNQSTTMQATIVNSGTEVTKTITNDSTLPTNTTKFTPAEDSYTYIYLRGAEYDLQGIYNNNIGKTYNIIVVPESTGGTGPHGQPTYTPKITRLTDIISTMNLSSYNEVELNINQNGDYPIIFYYENNWISFEHSVGYVQSCYYYAQMGLPNLPTKMVYSVPTNTVTLYRGNTAVYNGLADNVDIIYTYVASTSDGMDNVSTSVTLSGVGKPIPTYAYMQPEKGVTLRGISTLWSNGYENNIIDIMVCRETTNANNLTITAGSSYITISTQNNRMNVLLHDHNGTTTTQYIGMWPAAQIEINANEGSVSLTPLGGRISYTTPVDTNNTTITWHDWYDGGTITELTLSTSSTSMRFSVTRTTVFLDTYGVVMSNPTIDISDYFPEYTDYRLNFYSFALIGDSVTVNGNTYDVGDDQKITVTDPETGDSVTGTLNNVYVTETDGHTYFTFANSKETVDLGETTTHTVSFGGMWYFTTGFYNAVDAVEEVYNWNLDGVIHANLTQIMLIFIGLLLVGLVTVKKVLGFSFLSIDGIVIISAIVIGLIIAGGTL